MPNYAIFLDRDGTIIKDTGYILKKYTTVPIQKRKAATAENLLHILLTWQLENITSIFQIPM